MYLSLDSPSYTYPEVSFTHLLSILTHLMELTVQINHYAPLVKRPGPPASNRCQSMPVFEKFVLLPPMPLGTSQGAWHQSQHDAGNPWCCMEAAGLVCVNLDSHSTHVILESFFSRLHWDNLHLITTHFNHIICLLLTNTESCTNITTTQC